GNEIRRDIEELYLRSSRKPEAVALDFRAQLAGNITARDRVLALIGRYSAEVVKGVMRRIVDNGERAFLDKLKRLPDGVWRERSYVECCRPGDRRTHQVMLTLRKKGSTLVFQNEGTAPQDGAMNVTYSGWRGAIMVAFNQLLCWDQYFSIGGALRHVEFDPTPGTFNCADFPASVSTAPIQAMEISLYPTEVIDSGGAGKFRGGLSAESCFIPHRTESITQDTLSSGNAIPTSPGMMAGYPGSVNVYKFKRATDIFERLGERRIPGDIAELKGEEVTLALRQENFIQKPDDVYAVIWSAAGGFGDPLERDPEKVRDDVIDQRSVSAEAARGLYGVVIASDGRVDAQATSMLRAERREANRRKDGVVQKLDGKIIARVTENLDVRRDGSGLRTACAKCAADLGPLRDNYKDHCVRRESDVSAANPNIGDYRRYI